MKRILFVSFLSIIFSCSPKIYPVQSCVAISEQGSNLTIRATGYGKRKIGALDAAEKNAINTLLFRGISGTQNWIPLVCIDEETAKNEYQQYFGSPANIRGII